MVGASAKFPGSNRRFGLAAIANWAVNQQRTNWMLWKYYLACLAGVEIERNEMSYCEERCIEVLVRR